MSNPLPQSPHDDPLIERLESLGRSLAASEVDSGRTEAPAADSPFMQAVDRRAQFHVAGRLVPRLALAAAIAIVAVGAYLVVATRPPTVQPSPVATNTDPSDSQQPTLANLRKLNQDVTSPDQLKLAGGTGTAPSSPDTGKVSPIDARASDRIDAIMGGR